MGFHPSGVNVFGGGLALYNSKKQLVGALCVSGDSSCADHNTAWRTRNALQPDYVPNATSVSCDATRPDNIVYDIAAQVGQMPGLSASEWGHRRNGSIAALAGSLPVVAK